MRQILVFIFLTYAGHLCTQNKYSILTQASLEQSRSKALSENDSVKLADLDAEIENRKIPQQRISELKVELQKKIEIEDFLAAAKLKKEIDGLSIRKIKEDSLREKIAFAVANEDFENAAKYKKELLNQNSIASSGDSVVQTDSSRSKELRVDQNNPEPPQSGIRLNESSLPATPNQEVSKENPKISENEPQIKPFEGIIEFQETYDNVPWLYKSDFINSTQINYFKKNKRRYEEVTVEGKWERKTIKIYNFEKGEYLLIKELKKINKDDVRRSATLERLACATGTDQLITELAEEKNFHNLDCQKVNYKFVGRFANGFENIDLDLFVNQNYSSTGFYGQYIPFIILGYSPSKPLQNSDMVRHLNSTKFSEEPLSDALFETTPPGGVEVQDLRNTKLNTPTDKILLNTFNGERKKVIDTIFDSHSTNKPMATIFSSPFYTSYFFRACKGDTLIFNIKLSKSIAGVVIRNLNKSDNALIRRFRYATEIRDFYLVAGGDDIYEIEFENSNSKNVDVTLQIEKVTRNRVSCIRPIKYKYLQKTVMAENGVNGQTHEKKVPVPEF